MKNTFQDGPPSPSNPARSRRGGDGGGTEVETCGARPLMGDRGAPPPLKGGGPNAVRAVGCGGERVMVIL